ncbi:MAG: hypothetical protein WAO12_08685 [Venatoribacter sp.]
MSNLQAKFSWLVESWVLGVQRGACCAASLRIEVNLSFYAQGDVLLPGTLNPQHPTPPNQS